MIERQGNAVATADPSAHIVGPQQGFLDGVGR